LTERRPDWTKATQACFAVAISALLSMVLATSGPAFAENELAAKYGGVGLDTSLVDQQCLVNHCSLSAKACLQDDPSCRKGLTCTAKCMGDNACITGCMARYGNEHLDQLLSCTIEKHECIKVAILPGGADEFGTEPMPPAPVVVNFNPTSLEGSWYKVLGYNPNYDCYACQRNTFERNDPNAAEGIKKTDNRLGFIATTGTYARQHETTLGMDVEFSMPHLLPDGSPPPPSGTRETIRFLNEDYRDNKLDSSDFATLVGSESIGLNDYHTHETMIFDASPSLASTHKLINGRSYARTAHSEGEMFGLSTF
jgi:hypothetical protein